MLVNPDYPQLLNFDRVRRIACTNYLKAGFEQFLASNETNAEGGLSFGPTSFNSRDDALEYLINTARPMKVMYMGLDDAPNDQGGLDLGGSTAYVLDFTDLGDRMTATLAFFTDEKTTEDAPNVFLVWPEATYARLPLQLAQGDLSSPAQYLCQPGKMDEILRVLREAQILQTADVVPFKDPADQSEKTDDRPEHD